MGARTIYPGWNNNPDYPRTIPEARPGGRFDKERARWFLEQLDRVDQRMAMDLDYSLYDFFLLLVRDLRDMPFGVGITGSAEHAERYCEHDFVGTYYLVGDKLGINFHMAQQPLRLALCEAIDDYLGVLDEPSLAEFRERKLQRVRGIRSVMRANFSLRGWVYFLLIPERGLVKIGYTGRTSPYARMAEVQTGTPDRVELIHVMRGYQNLETRLHEKFDKYRHRGEWFRCEGDLLDWLFCEGVDIDKPPVAPSGVA